MRSIKYQIMTEVNSGTEDEPNIVKIFFDKEILCAEEFFEQNLAIAQAEAYSGEVTVEEVPDVEEPSAPLSSVWEELDAAYREGVNSAYDQ